MAARPVVDAFAHAQVNSEFVVLTNLCRKLPITTSSCMFSKAVCPGSDASAYARSFSGFYEFCDPRVCAHDRKEHTHRQLLAEQ